MKKLLTPTLTILMVISLTACIGNQDNRNEKSSAGGYLVEKASSTIEGSNVQDTSSKLMMVSLTACSGNQANSNEKCSAGSSSVEKASSTIEGRNVQDTSSKASNDSAQVLPKGSNMATRTIKNGTAITMTVGDTVIPATLNNSTSSKELLSRLPYTVHINRFSHDYSGVMKDPLKYDEKDVHNGWMNGDINFERDVNYFTILFEDEKKSKIYGEQVNMGKVDCDLSVIKGLGSSIDVQIDLAR
ncbi:hypothetical protein LL033_07905 [Clostridium estertheticum]|uniref:cyclophilin-like fold protein n=1 Tax=Clostridium estertheticum TaxID=238834 RepID=UPI001C0ADC39|nr:cyclophilin-like fold protein [Clostridium estertheticum]MBU3214735.1 hypothetical protein [Clostridium estertheticum]WAG57147.1 hypothetical protein LL033_07905 [Clostridium estertheticum]